MATEARENLLLDLLLVRAQAVNGGPTYNTNPAIKDIGLPRDARFGPGEAIYLEHVRTLDLVNDGTTASHRKRATFHAWCIGDTDREALNVKDDFERAILLAERAFDTLAPYGARIVDCLKPDPATIEKIGKSIRIIEFEADFELTHS